MQISSGHPCCMKMLHFYHRMSSSDLVIWLPHVCCVFACVDLSLEVKKGLIRTLWRREKVRKDTYYLVCKLHIGRMSRGTCMVFLLNVYVDALRDDLIVRIPDHKCCKRMVWYLYEVLNVVSALKSVKDGFGYREDSIRLVWRTYCLTGQRTSCTHRTHTSLLYPTAFSYSYDTKLYVWPSDPLYWKPDYKFHTKIFVPPPWQYFESHLRFLCQIRSFDH